MSTGAKIKGWIKNLESGGMHSFQYNPEIFSRSRSASFVGYTSPLCPYPIIHYAGGIGVTIPLRLFMYDKPCTGTIKAFIEFLNGLLPPEYMTASFKKPPKVLFCYGNFVKTCLLESYTIDISEYDESGQETIADITLSFLQIEV